MELLDHNSSALSSHLINFGRLKSSGNVPLINSVYYTVWQSLGGRKALEVEATEEESGESSSYIFQSLLLFLTLLLLLKYGIRRPYSKEVKSARKERVPLVKWSFPVSIPLLESFYTIYNCRKYGLKYLDILASTYGSLCELPVGFQKCYIVSDATVIQKIVTSTNPNHLNKTKFFYDRIFFGALNDALVASDTHIWAPHRKILSRAFTYKALQSYLGIVNCNTKLLAQHMVQAASASGSIEGKEIYDIKYLHTVKIIANIVMGSDMLTNEETRIFRENVRTYQKLVMGRVVHPILMINLIWRLHPQSKELDSAVDNMCIFIKKVTDIYKEKREMERKQGIEWVDAEDDDVGMRPFRCMMEEMIHGGMSDKEIVDEVVMFLIAGHETSAAAINMMMFHLALHPEYQKMCRDEVDELLASKLLQTDYELEMTMDDLTNLKIVERCILETLRLTAAIPVFIRRMDEPLKIDDEFTIEKGRNVFLVPWSLHRDPKHYPNPEKFDPDRFLPENVKQRHPYSFLPFSAGQRNCIGWKLSMMEMKMVIFWILRNFEIYTTDKLENIHFRFEISIKADKDIHLILNRRTVGNSSADNKME